MPSLVSCRPRTSRLLFYQCRNKNTVLSYPTLFFKWAALAVDAIMHK